MLRLALLLISCVTAASEDTEPQRELNLAGASHKWWRVCSARSASLLQDSLTKKHMDDCLEDSSGTIGFYSGSHAETWSIDIADIGGGEEWVTIQSFDGRYVVAEGSQVNLHDTIVDTGYWKIIPDGDYVRFQNKGSNKYLEKWGGHNKPKMYTSRHNDGRWTTVAHSDRNALLQNSKPKQNVHMEIGEAGPKAKKLVRREAKKGKHGDKQALEIDGSASLQAAGTEAAHGHDKKITHHEHEDEQSRPKKSEGLKAMISRAVAKGHGAEKEDLLAALRSGDPTYWTVCSGRSENGDLLEEGSDLGALEDSLVMKSDTTSKCLEDSGGHLSFYRGASPETWQMEIQEFDGTHEWITIKSHGDNLLKAQNSNDIVFTSTISDKSKWMLYIEGDYVYFKNKHYGKYLAKAHGADNPHLGDAHRSSNDKWFVTGYTTGRHL